MAFDFNKLNKQQLEAVKCTEGPVIVTAGAGTGKTRLLTNRIAYLVENCGVSPTNILAITFTNKATNEMRERILNNLENGYLVTISTFHSLCVKILRNHIDKLDTAYNRFFTIYDDSEQEKVLKKILKEAGEAEDDFRKELTYYIAKAKNAGVFPTDFENAFSYVKNSQDIIKYYNLYNEELKRCNALDFDDLILKTLELFKKHPSVLNYYQDKFKYIHIDEFQDTNLVQYDLAFMLAQKYNNILVVGDEDQSIYGWRGANYKNLFNFLKDFKDVKVFKLEENYRSTYEILSKANKLISNNNERFEKVLFTSNKGGEKVDFLVFEDDYKEADYIAKKISTAVNNRAKYSDFACLYRVNSVSRTLEKALVNNGIPYEMFGGLKFYSRAEIKNLLAYLRLLVNSSDEEALNRIINFPRRGIGNVTLEKLMAEAKDKGISSLNYILGLEGTYKNKGVILFKEFFEKFKHYSLSASLTETVQFLINGINVNEIYGGKTEEDYERLLNIKSFISAVNEFEETAENPTFVDFLENVSLTNDAQNSASNGEAVILATVHAAKGLEFENVFIIAVEENMFPFAKSVEEGNIQEERRLMYVAVTRAKRKLVLTSASNRFSFGGGFSAFAIKSRFIGEMGLLPESSFAFERKEYNNYDKYSYKSGYSKPAYSKSNSKNNTQSATEFLKGLSSLHKASDYYSQPKNALEGIKVGTKISHVRFGEGIIKEFGVNNSKNAIIEFDDGVKKELNLEFAPIEILGD